MNRVFSKEFVQGWKKALIDTYGFEEYMDFVVQPSFGKKYLSYLPFINYTDRMSDEIDDLLELAKDNHFQIRTLNFNYQDFKDHDPVTLRLDVGGLSEEELMMQRYKKLSRKLIRKYARDPKLHLEQKDDIPTYYAILKEIFKDHGTPVFPIELLYNFKKHLGQKMHIFLLYHDNEPVGGTLTFCDNGIGMLHMGGIPNRFKHISTGHYMDHNIIMHLKNLCDIQEVDFGRSPYNGGTYFYKTRFGAKPVKIDIHTDIQKDIYSAYSWASKVWQKLPNSVTDYLGPKLTKYLVDL